MSKFRTLRETERLASNGLLLGMFALMMLTGTVLLFALSAHGTSLKSQELAREAQASEKRLRSVITEHCEERRTSYAAERRLRTVQEREWKSLAEQERKNPFIDAKVRDARVKSYLEMAEAAEQAAAAVPTSSCSEYRFAGLEGVPS